MPGRDRTGPTGLGAATGRGRGDCSGYAPDDLSVIILRFIFAHWRPILGFLITTALPLLGRKFFQLNTSANNLQLTVSPIKGNKGNDN